MAAQAVSGPVLELILALFWTPRNRENRAPVEARGYFLPKSPHALGRSTSPPKWSNLEPQSGPKTSPGGLRRGTHAVPQRCSNLALKSKRFWTILEPKRGSQMGPRIGPKSALAPKGRPEAAEAPPEASRGPLGTNVGSLLDLIWDPFWNSRKLIFEQPQRQRRQRQSQPLPPPPPPPLAPQGLQLWSLWFHHGGLGRQPHWNRSRNRLLVFRFRAFRSRVLGFSSGGSWALAWGHGL